MNPWPYILAAYLLAAIGLVSYLFSVIRRRKALTTQVAALKRHAEDRVR